VNDLDSDQNIHLQARDNLLKSFIFAQEDIDHELNDYVLSVINLFNKGMYEENYIDRFFIDKSLLILKDEELKNRFHDLESFKQLAESLPLDEREQERRKKRESFIPTYEYMLSDRTTGHRDRLDFENEKTAQRPAKMYPAKHRWAGKHVVSGDMISRWPKSVTDSSSYRDNPFSNILHPLLKTNSKHGYPEFVEKLKNYYLSSEDDTPLSQLHGEIEMRHNNHHKKNGDMVLDNKYLGDLSEHSEGHGTLEHTLYEKAYQKWVEDNRASVDEMIKNGSTDKDVRNKHFEEAANKWISDDYQEIEGSNLQDNRLYVDIQKLIDNGNFKESENARDYLLEYKSKGKYGEGEIEHYDKQKYLLGPLETHSHKLGWLGYNLGLEWLEPKDRSKVIEHLLEHQSDGKESHQSHVTLSDGVKLPMARLKRNAAKRAMPEMLWATGSHDRALPNTKAHRENKEEIGDFDTDKRVHFLNTGMRETKVKTGKEGKKISLNESLLKNLNDKLHKNMYDQEDFLENPAAEQKIKDANSLSFLPVTDYEMQGVKQNYQKGLRGAFKNQMFIDENGEKLPLAEMKRIDAKILHTALKTFNRNAKDRRETFHATGSIKDLKKHYAVDEGKHPIHELLGDSEDDDPLMDAEHLESLEKRLEQGFSVGDTQKNVLNHLQPFTRIKGPTEESVDGDTATHFHKTKHGLEGLQNFWAHGFQRGGLSTSPETYMDFLHEMTINPEEPNQSLFGVKNEKSGILDLHSNIAGLFGLINSETLPPYQKFAHTPKQVLSIHDSSQPKISKRSGMGMPRNLKNHNISEHSRTPGVSHKIKNSEIGKLSHLGINMADNGLHSNTNPTARVGSTLGYTFDTTISSNSSGILRDSVLRGIGHNPGDKDIATGRTKLGSPVSMYGLEDLFIEGKVPLPNIGDKSDFLQFMTDKNTFARSEGEQIKTLNLDIEQIIEELNYSVILEGNKKVGLSEVEKKHLTDRYQELENQKLEIIRQMYNIDDSDTSLGSPHGVMLRNLREKKSDLNAIHDIAREHIIPGMKKANPDAFPLDNPSQFLIDSAQALHDAELFALHSDGSIHGKNSLGLTHNEIETDSIQTKLGQSPHRDMAQSVRDNGISLDLEREDKDEYINELFEKLSIPPSDYNKKIVEGVLQSGKTHLTTMGNLLAQEEHVPNHVKDHKSMIEHYEEQLNQSTYGRGTKNLALDKSHLLNRMPARKHLLLSQATKDELEHWGLDYHQLPKNIYGNESKGTSVKDSGIPSKTKRFMDSLVSYDEGASPDIENTGDVGRVTRDEVIHGSNKINSVRSNDGINPYLYYSSSAQKMHNGKVMLPSSTSMNIDRDGNAQWGNNTQQSYMIPASEEGLVAMHGENTISQIQGLANQQGLDTMYVSPTSNLDRISAENPIPESTNYENIATSFDKITNSSLLKNLPKEMPLLDPYHKVFDYENVEELKGFTGDWVVAAMEVGQRVKVTRKGTFIEVKSNDGDKIGLSDSMRTSIRKLGSKNFIMDGVLNDKGITMVDLMYYDDTDVTDMDVRERMKLLRSQFDSHENIFIPSPSTLRMTDEDGLEEAIKYLRSENKDCKILIRDAKSTYMKGEEKHPKWILLTKSDDDFHIPFTMELEENVFIINYEHDIVKFDIVDEEPINPRAILGELNNSDYTLTLTKSLEKYWRPAFYEMVKEEKDEDDTEDDEVISDRRAEVMEQESAGILKPKKDPNLLLKPNMLKNIIEIIERSMDALEKGHFPMSGGKGLGIDVGSDIESPRGPTKLTNEASLPDWDMKERPQQDPEKPEKYPNREKKALETKRID
tara:strand:- start:506 stop:5914 length:5409 start_codon:yes stop_codon:yes gene_type:complete